ncbi:hypothetical protein J0910_24085 [Nocardiopsis sp. CNT-189]|uniref:hypothetical protein n=1 Tax=Nocardiopsis oceanisediminis TaxID=2816862 RepID=UPI003B311FB1
MAEQRRRTGADRGREESAARMRPGGNAGAGGGHQVRSLYCDADRPRFYREKTECLRFRRKLRVRAPEGPDGG